MQPGVKVGVNPGLPRGGAPETGKADDDVVASSGYAIASHLRAD